MLQYAKIIASETLIWVIPSRLPGTWLSYKNLTDEYTTGELEFIHEKEVLS